MFGLFGMNTLPQFPDWVGENREEPELDCAHFSEPCFLNRKNVC